jgi:SAM-dependent methyltransferase
VNDPRVSALIDAAARPFAAAGHFALHFARNKLRHDPVYLALLQRGTIPDCVRVLDLGCGQGILMSLLLAARTQYRADAWPDGWPAPPQTIELHGIERRPNDVLRVRRALGERVTVTELDLRHAPLASSDVIVLLDVLHYLDEDAQESLLENATKALRPDGVLVARVSDAAARFGSLVSQTVDYAVSVARGALQPRMHMRGAIEWLDLFEGLGLNASAEPMSSGTPFANVLVVGRRSLNVMAPAINSS